VNKTGYASSAESVGHLLLRSATSMGRRAVAGGLRVRFSGDQNVEALSAKVLGQSQN